MYLISSSAFQEQPAMIYHTSEVSLSQVVEGDIEEASRNWPYVIGMY